MRRLLTAIFALLVLVLVLAGLGGISVKTVIQPGPLAEAKVVVVPHGTPSEIAVLLANAGVIGNQTAFRLAASLTEGKGAMKSGEFAFPEHASLFGVLNILRYGRPVQHKVTIPEGLTAYQITAILQRAASLDGEVPKFAEAEVFPDTYSYTYGTPRSAIVDRGRAEMDKNLAKVWEVRDTSIPLAVPQQLVIIASLVERETSRPEERAHVAAVYLNRFRLGMKLQADPTVAYAASGGQSTSERNITRAELEARSPYNTYVVTGLPPSAIASPGLAAMLAVARPTTTDDLYFVADGEGGHVFAKNLEDHNRNVAKYRAAIKP